MNTTDIIQIKLSESELKDLLSDNLKKIRVHNKYNLYIEIIKN